MKQIESLLQQTMGLHAATIGSSLIERAVRARMRSHDLTKKDDYLDLLHASTAEWDALVEAIVITETWFFRDLDTFQALVRMVFNEWLPARPTGTLRLLSLPCASGEEPYSIAMALIDAGLPAQRFQIDAVDISARALARAEQAVYGKNSFRGNDLDCRTRHFQPVADGHLMNPSVRMRVKFQRGNLLNDQCLLGMEPYDFVFCRNLLIYFDGPTQASALIKLRRTLAPSGTLFLGPAELPVALDHGFVSANCPSSFACRHPDAAEKTFGQLLRQNKSGAKSTLRATPRVLSTPQAAQPSTDLARARQLADEGRLAEAAEICETHLREYGVSAEAFYLLGLVRNAAGAESQAGEFYRKALYLEPDHYESLMQWASLSNRKGNRDQARILQKRAERVKRRT